MDDLISRQMAIDAVSEGCQEWRGIFERCKEKLLTLPTAQPDHTADNGKKVCVDAISRQAAIHAALEDVSGKRTHEFNAGATRAANRIKRLPSAQTATNCSEIPNGSDDTISRQAAIDALDCINGVEEVLRALPSAQPDHTADNGKKVCVDAISRQAAVELAMKYCPDDDGAVQCDGDIRGLLDELENLSSAQPEPKWIPCSERMPEEG